MKTNFEKTSATKRISVGIIISIIRNIVRTAHPLLLVPLFLRAWGADTYGRWLTLTALLAYINILNFGGQNYVGNLLTLDMARNDIESYKRHLSEAMSFFIILCSVVVAGIALLMMIPGMSFPGIKGVLTVSDRLILFFMGSSTILWIIHNIYMTNYHAHGLWSYSSVFYIVFGLLSVIVRAGILLMFIAPAQFAGIYFLLNILHMAIMVWDVRRKVQLARSFRFSFPAAIRGISYLRDSLFFWLITLSFAINNQGTVLIASEVLGTTTVTLYVTHRILTNLLTYPTSIVRNPLDPELSRLAGQERFTEMRQIQLFAIRTISILTFGLALGVYVWAPIIYPIWLGNEFNINMPLLLILLVQMILSAGWDTSGWTILAANAHRKVAIAQIINAITTVILAILWTPAYGILGLAFASLMGDVLCTLTAYPYFAGRFLSMNPIKIYAAMLRSWLAFVPYIVLILTLRFVIHDIWWNITATGLGIVFVYPITLIGLGYEETHKIIQNIWKRVKPTIALS